VVKYRDTPDGVLRVSEIGLGTYALAGVYGEKDPGRFKTTLRKAYDLGVTLFDTAPVYGDAEEVVGEVLADVRSKIILSTKVATGIEGGPSCSFDSVIASCDTSLRRLKTDYVDLYQIHFDDGETPTEEVVRAFEHLKALGKIRAYGIGHVSFERAREYVEVGNVSTIMGELNAVSRKYYTRMRPLLEAGCGYVGFSLTGRGILTGAFADRGRLAREDIRRMDAVFAGERLKSALRTRDRLAEVGEKSGATPVQAAIRWALAQERVVAGLIGPSTVGHLEEDLKATEISLGRTLLREFNQFLSAEDARLARGLRTEMASILDRRITDSSSARELIYVIEGLAELGLAPEQDLIGHIRTAIAILRGGTGDISGLETIRKALLEYVNTR
jgi:aryl-alcohol dehydrogenase-like predicted oxidoreductase